MSASIEDDDSLSFDENQDENSDCASSRASSMKRPRRTAQIRSTAWVQDGEITPVLQNDSLLDPVAGDAQEGDQHSQNTIRTWRLHLVQNLKFFFKR
jgi:hypothetical protein